MFDDDDDGAMMMMIIIIPPKRFEPPFLLSTLQTKPIGWVDGHYELDSLLISNEERSIEMHQLLVVNLIQHYKRTMKGKKEKNIEASQVTERKNKKTSLTDNN